MFEEVLIGGLFLVLNLIVFGLNLKLYTEILKDKSQNRRVSPGSGYQPHPSDVPPPPPPGPRQR